MAYLSCLNSRAKNLRSSKTRSEPRVFIFSSQHQSLNSCTLLMVFLHLLLPEMASNLTYLVTKPLRGVPKFQEGAWVFLQIRHNPFLAQLIHYRPHLRIRFPPSLPSRSSSVAGQEAHRACPLTTSLLGGSEADGLARRFTRVTRALSRTSRVETTTLRLGPADHSVERGSLVSYVTRPARASTRHHRRARTPGEAMSRFVYPPTT